MSEVTPKDILAHRVEAVSNILEETLRDEDSAPGTPLGTGEFEDPSTSVKDPYTHLDRGDTAVIRASGAVVVDTCYSERNALPPEEEESKEETGENPDQVTP